ncbi:hypothetical protein EXN66_Car007158 [Channa argus]|uniref:Uncharacterized protein n=1 Tax=Channa argus TaxID=215402 RepID=A0A6G1PMT6_CHAAH|nr:hypothetical protein EXN66_Car007158 [Channa argus]
MWCKCKLYITMSSTALGAGGVSASLADRSTALKLEYVKKRHADLKATHLLLKQLDRFKRRQRDRKGETTCCQS